MYIDHMMAEQQIRRKLKAIRTDEKFEFCNALFISTTWCPNTIPHKDWKNFCPDLFHLHLFGCKPRSMFNFTMELLLSVTSYKKRLAFLICMFSLFVLVGKREVRGSSENAKNWT